MSTRLHFRYNLFIYYITDPFMILCFYLLLINHGKYDYIFLKQFHVINLANGYSKERRRP